MIYIATSKTQKNMQKMSIMERKVLFFHDTNQKVSQVGPFISSHQICSALLPLPLLASLPYSFPILDIKVQK